MSFKEKTQKLISDYAGSVLGLIDQQPIFPVRLDVKKLLDSFGLE